MRMGGRLDAPLPEGFVVRSLYDDAVLSGMHGLEMGWFGVWGRVQAGSAATLSVELPGIACASGDAWLRTDCLHYHVVPPLTRCRPCWASISRARARLSLQ
jgi:hypothetical protein